MNLKDYADIQRLIGVIEGAAFGVSESAADAILNAVAAIDEILERIVGDNNAE